MKQFFYFLIFMFVFTGAKSQKTNKNYQVISNYQQAIKQGDSARDRQNFEFAINKYFAAEAYEPSRNDEVKFKIDTVFQKIIKVKEEALRAKNEALKAKNEAVKAEEKAKEQKEIQFMLSVSFLLNTMALESVNENPTFALRMTQIARNISDSFKILELAANRIYNENAFYKKIDYSDSSVTSVAFSPDGNIIITASGDSITWFQNMNGSNISTLRHRYAKAVSSVAFSKNGKRILSGTKDSTVILWDEEGNQVLAFKQKAKVFSIAVSSRNQILIGLSDNTAQLCNLDGKWIREFTGHKGSINAVAFSPSGDTLITGSSDSTARMWTLNTDTAIRIFKHADTVYSVAFSPTRNQILTGSSDKVVRLWNLADTLEAPLEFKDQKGGVRSVAFSKTGDNILTGSYDNTARLLDLRGKTIKEFKGHTGGLNAVAFSPVDGQRIITGSEDGTARIWYFTEETSIPEFKNSNEAITSIAIADRNDSLFIATGSTDGIARLHSLNGNLHKEFKIPFSGVSSIFFSPVGDKFLTGSNDSTIRLWQLNGEMIREFKKNTNGIIRYAAFSPDGNTILAGYPDSSAALFNIQGDLIQKFESDIDINYVAFSPDEKKILTGLNGSVDLWDLETGKKRRFNEDIFSFDFSLKEKKIILGSRNGKIQIWEWDQEGNLKQKLEINTDAVYDVAFSPDGNNFLTVSLNNRNAVLWNLKGDMLSKFEDVNYYYAFSPDGKKIATISNDGTAKLCSLDGTVVARFNGHTGKINSIKFSPATAADSTSDSKILTGSQDGTARLWKQNGQLVKEFGKRGSSSLFLAEFSPDGKSILTSSNTSKHLWSSTGKLIREFKNLPPGILSVAYSIEKQMMLSGYDDGTVGLWDARGNMKQIEDHTSAVNAVAFSATGDSIFSASYDTTVVLRDLKKDSVIKIFRDHSGPVNALAISRDGNDLLTGSDDSTAVLRNLTNDSIVRPKGHYDKVTSVAFSKTGDTLLTGYVDGTARMWDKSGNLLQEIFISYLSSVKSVAFSPDGRTILTGSADGIARLWDLYGTPIKSFPDGEPEFTGELNAAIFLPEKKIILTGSGDGIARFWSLGEDLDAFLVSDKIEMIDKIQLEALDNFIFGEDYRKAYRIYGTKTEKYVSRKSPGTITPVQMSKFLNDLLKYHNKKN